MNIKWTSQAVSDLQRIYQHLAVNNTQDAARQVQLLMAAPMQNKEQLRMGERSDYFGERDVRRFLIGQYEIRYELKNKVPYILRIWYTEETR